MPHTPDSLCIVRSCCVKLYPTTTSTGVVQLHSRFVKQAHSRTDQYVSIEFVYYARTFVFVNSGVATLRGTVKRKKTVRCICCSAQVCALAFVQYVVALTDSIHAVIWSLRTQTSSDASAMCTDR